jgi:hypothetical protein
MVQRRGSKYGLATNTTLKQTPYTSRKYVAEIWDPEAQVPRSLNKANMWEILSESTVSGCDPHAATRAKREQKDLNRQLKKSEYIEQLHDQKQKHLTRDMETSLNRIATDSHLARIAADSSHAHHKGQYKNKRGHRKTKFSDDEQANENEDEEMIPVYTHGGKHVAPIYTREEELDHAEIWLPPPQKIIQRGSGKKKAAKADRDKRSNFSIFD